MKYLYNFMMNKYNLFNVNEANKDNLNKLKIYCMSCFLKYEMWKLFQRIILSSIPMNISYLYKKVLLYCNTCLYYWLFLVFRYSISYSIVHIVGPSFKWVHVVMALPNTYWCICLNKQKLSISCYLCLRYDV